MPIPDPDNHHRDWPSLFRAYVDEELSALNTADIALIERIDADSLRVDVALKADPEVILDDVPVATPFAANGVGDIPPLRPGDEGMLVFADLPLDEGLLADRGFVDQQTTRMHRIDDAVFMPAMVFYDADDVPNYNQQAAERVIAHPDGSRLRMHEGRTELSHGDPTTADVSDIGDDAPPRVRLRLTTDPYFEERLAAEATPGDDAGWTSDTIPTAGIAPPGAGIDAEQQWPRDREPAALIEHPSETRVTVTEQGVSVTPGETPTGDRRRGLHAGAMTDPERIRVRGHRHEIRGVAQPVTDEGVTVSGDGTETVTIPHTLGVVPGYVDVTPRTEDAAADFWVAEKTAADVTIEYAGGRPTGTDNLVYDVFAHPPTGPAADVYVTTAPLTRREQTARLTAADEWAGVANAGEASGDLAAARTRAENHRAYLGMVTGNPALDPTDPAAWPSLEHVPETPEWVAWSDPAYDPTTFTPPDDAAETGVDIDLNLDLDE